MIDADLLSSALEAASDAGLARRRAKHLKPLKGLRGTPLGEVARQGAAAWRRGVDLFEDAEQLHALFCTAQEDGLLAVGLAAAAAPDDPDEALTLALRWLEMVDDLETADALGWTLYGPALLAGGRDLTEALLSHRGEAPIRRRTALIAVMAALPVPLEGPAAAALRERVGEAQVVVVEAPMGEVVARVCEGYRKDPDPHVRKALGRVLRAWGEVEPAAAAAWLAAAIAGGGLPRVVREQAERGIKRGRRKTVGPGAEAG